MLQRARRGGIRPISIGRALLHQLDAQFDGLHSNGAVTPKYVITLHPDDALELNPFKRALLDELCQAVIHHASIESYTLSSAVEIKLETDPSTKRGTCTIVSSSDQASISTPPVDRPKPNIESAKSNALANEAIIVLDNGERIPLIGELATVGRQSDCQIIIDDNNVSRIHAEIRRTTEGWVVTDRGSTNGSKVNGEKIVGGRLLVNGDTIAFGSAFVQFENS